MAPKKNSSEYQLLLPAHQVTYEEIDLKLLDVEAEAQRETSSTRVDSIELDFVQSACPALTVAKYADTKGKTRYYTVDGGHRLDLLRDRLGVKKFWCEVHHGLDQQGRAVLFIIRNREIKVPNALEQFNVGLVANLPLYVDVQDVLLGASPSLRIGNSPSKNVVAAVSAVTTAVEKYGKDALADAIDLLDATYARADSLQWDGAIVLGTARFCASNPTIDLKVVSTRMARARITASAANLKQEILVRTSTTSAGNATSGGSGSRYNAAARIIAEVYNKGIRTGLRAA